MSSNYWNQQQGDAPNPQQHSPSMIGNENGVPRSGRLLSNYNAHNAQQTMPAPQGWPTPQGPSSVSPIPPSSAQFLPPHLQQQFPEFPQAQQMPHGSQYPHEWPADEGGHPASAFANAMNTVRRWSGKMGAARGCYVDPNPFVMHRPQYPERVNRRVPWKRSHALRVSMPLRHSRARWQRSRPNKKKTLTITFSIFAALLVVLLASGFG